MKKPRTRVGKYLSSVLALGLLLTGILWQPGQLETVLAEETGAEEGGAENTAATTAAVVMEAETGAVVMEAETGAVVMDDYVAFGVWSTASDSYPITVVCGEAVASVPVSVNGGDIESYELSSGTGTVNVTLKAGANVIYFMNSNIEGSISYNCIKLSDGLSPINPVCVTLWGDASNDREVNVVDLVQTKKGSANIAGAVAFGSEDASKTLRQLIVGDSETMSTYDGLVAVEADACIDNVVYTALAKAVSDAVETEAAKTAEGVTIEVVAPARVSLTAGISIPANTRITITDDGWARTVGTSGQVNLFNVKSGATFALGRSDKEYTGTITVDGSGVTSRMIENAGTFTLGYNATLTGMNNGTWGNVVINRSGTCNLYGNITGNVCTSTNFGALILNNAATVVLNFYAGTYSNNTGSSAGLVYDSAGGTINVYDGMFSNNSYSNASVGAGGVFRCANGENVKLNIAGGTFTSNSGKRYGGVVYATGQTTVTITGGTFTSNSASSHGGVIYASGSAKITIEGGTFTGNRAYLGGGVMVLQDQASAEISKAVMKGNYVTNTSPSDGTKLSTYQGGGAILLTAGSSVTLTGCTISDNTRVGTSSTGANTNGFDIGFRGDGRSYTQNLILKDSTFAGIVGWYHVQDSETICQVTFEDGTIGKLESGCRYTVDAANHTLAKFE